MPDKMGPRLRGDDENYLTANDWPGRESGIA